MTSLETGRSGTAGAAAAAHWAPRLALAAVFLFHGLTKFPDLSGGAEMMNMPVWLWTLVALGEVAAGAALLAGGAIASAPGDRLTRLGGLGVIIIMIGAIALVHWGQWSFQPSESHPMGGMEFQVLMLATGLFFLARGNSA
ncbi:DoxX family protein [Roseobacteraceae bacterium NS-SX3]